MSGTGTLARAPVCQNSTTAILAAEAAHHPSHYAPSHAQKTALLRGRSWRAFRSAAILGGLRPSGRLEAGATKYPSLFCDPGQTFHGAAGNTALKSQVANECFAGARIENAPRPHFLPRKLSTRWLGFRGGAASGGGGVWGRGLSCGGGSIAGALRRIRRRR